MMHFLAYLAIYLLFALAFDLLRQLFDPHGINRHYGAIRRKLWSDSTFDCRSLVFSMDADQRKYSSRGRTGGIRLVKPV